MSVKEAEEISEETPQQHETCAVRTLAAVSLSLSVTSLVISSVIAILVILSYFSPESDLNKIPDLCLLPPDPGPCTSSVNRRVRYLELLNDLDPRYDGHNFALQVVSPGPCWGLCPVPLGRMSRQWQQLYQRWPVPRNLQSPGDRRCSVTPSGHDNIVFSIIIIIIIINPSSSDKNTIPALPAATWVRALQWQNSEILLWLSKQKLSEVYSDQFVM